MERISALMDGELETTDLLSEMQRIKGEDGLMRSWETYHLIGDVLRAERPLSAGFADRVSAALASEPTVLAPRPIAASRKVRLYALSAAASIAGVATVAWLAFMNHPATLDDVARTASTSTERVVAPSTVAELSPDGDPSVDEYLRVHQAYSPSATIPGIAPYVRSVSVRERDMAR